MDHGLTVQPFEFQRGGIKFALPRPYCMIADSMGLGKTLQGIAIANISKAKCLVVCPSFLKLNWVLEIHKLCAAPKHVSIFDKATDIYGYTPDLDDFVIINYEQVKHAESLFEWADMVISDEGHYLKNPDAQRTIYFDKYLYENMPDRFVLLTGTPIQNRVEELFQLLRLIEYDPKYTGPRLTDTYQTKTAFCNQFSNQVRMKINGRMIIKWEGVRNAEELRDHLENLMIRRLQEDVHELPEFIDIEVVASYKQDKKLAREFENHSKDQGKDITAKEKSARLKAKFTTQYVKDLIDQGIGKVVVFSDHVAPAEEIAAALGVPAITGKMSKKRRMELVKEFQEGELEAFVATIGAAKEGLTLTAASNMVLNDLPWVPGDLKQARKRIHRIGQNNKCKLHYIIGSFQDAYISRVLREKVKTIEEVL